MWDKYNSLGYKLFKLPSHITSFLYGFHTNNWCSKNPIYQQNYHFSLSGGGARGIGVETVRVLALRGVHVIMGVRNMDAGIEVKESIAKRDADSKIDVMELDLSSMESVKKFASNLISSGLPLNILVNNAGVLTSQFVPSKDNIELQFATNHVGHFLLTNLLLDTMKRTCIETKKEGRIVNVSSVAHKLMPSRGEIDFEKIIDRTGYDKTYGYHKSKLANILHANELARRLKEEGVEITANSVHPGIVETIIGQDNGFIFNGLLKLFKFALKNVEQGAATTCYVALNPLVKGISGEYFSNSCVDKASSQATDVDLAGNLWDFSDKLVLTKSTIPTLC